MKQFTLQEFKYNYKKCLKHSVFQLTKYGKPICIVMKNPEGIAQHFDKDTQEAIDFVSGKGKSHNISEQIAQHPQVAVGHCQAPYCKHNGEVFDGLYKEWFNGELKTKPMKLCQTHLDKYEAMTE